MVHLHPAQIVVHLHPAQSVCVCVCVRARESESLFVCVRKRERVRVCVSKRGAPAARAEDYLGLCGSYVVRGCKRL